MITSSWATAIGITPSVSAAHYQFRRSATRRISRACSSHLYRMLSANPALAGRPSPRCRTRHSNRRWRHRQRPNDASARTRISIDVTEIRRIRIISDGIIRMLRQSPPIRRNHLGELYELTATQRRQCADLARKECCNYREGHCLLLENIDRDDNCPCVQEISNHIECRWFQNAVLPIDWKLEAEIFKDDQMHGCERCGALFRATGRNMRYCPDCGMIMKKIRHRDRNRKYRLNIQK